MTPPLSRYQAYNLVIDSELRLPELPPFDSTSKCVADVVIRCAVVPPPSFDGREPIGPFLWVSPMSSWLEVPGIARFLVKNGTEILVESMTDGDNDSIHVFLLGSVLAALLVQRGHFLLRGCALAIDGKCMVCVGPRGIGKSTLAYGLTQRGYSIVSDDFVALNENYSVLPGVQNLKLWQETAEQLKLDKSARRIVWSSPHRVAISVGTGGGDLPLPVHWIYVLGVRDVGQTDIELIQGMQRFAPLRDNTYRLRMLLGMTLRREHLKFCAQLASGVHLARAIRPRVGFTLDETVDAIVRDIEAHS